MKNKKELNKMVQIRVLMTKMKNKIINLFKILTKVF